MLIALQYTYTNLMILTAFRRPTPRADQQRATYILYNTSRQFPRPFSPSERNVTINLWLFAPVKISTINNTETNILQWDA